MASVETAANMADSVEGMKLLFEYTKFHIGVYLTLTTAFITLATSNVGGILPKLNPCAAGVAIVFIMFAGLAGGVIISSITQCECSSVKDLLNDDLGFWGIELFTGRAWTIIEHTCFWIGLIAAVFAFKYSE
jgi:hypothetical protein